MHFALMAIFLVVPVYLAIRLQVEVAPFALLSLVYLKIRLARLPVLLVVPVYLALEVEEEMASLVAFLREADDRTI